MKALPPLNLVANPLKPLKPKFSLGFCVVVVVDPPKAVPELEGAPFEVNEDELPSPGPEDDEAAAMKGEPLEANDEKPPPLEPKVILGGGDVVRAGDLGVFVELNLLAKLETPKDANVRYRSTNNDVG